MRTEKDKKSYCLRTTFDRLIHEKISRLGAPETQADFHHYFDLCNYIAYGQKNIVVTIFALPASFFILWLFDAKLLWFGVCGFFWFNLMFFFILLTRGAQYALRMLHKENSPHWNAVCSRLSEILRKE